MRSFRARASVRRVDQLFTDASSLRLKMPRLILMATLQRHGGKRPQGLPNLHILWSRCPELPANRVPRHGGWRATFLTETVERYRCTSSKKVPRHVLVHVHPIGHAIRNRYRDALQHSLMAAPSPGESNVRDRRCVRHIHRPHADSRPSGAIARSPRYGMAVAPAVVHSPKPRWS